VVGFRAHDAGHGDNCCLGGAGAEADDHVASGSVDGKVHSKSSCQRLRDDVDFPTASAQTGFTSLGCNFLGEDTQDEDGNHGWCKQGLDTLQVGIKAAKAHHDRNPDDTQYHDHDGGDTTDQYVAFFGFTFEVRFVEVFREQSGAGVEESGQ